MNFKLITKFRSPHVADIGIVFPNGSGFTVARIAFPEDYQLADTTDCLREVMKILSKRYKGSV